MWVAIGMLFCGVGVYAGNSDPEEVFRRAVAKASTESLQSTFWSWSYGPGIQMDAIYDGARVFSGADFTNFASKVLDGFLADKNSIASQVLDNNTIPWGYAVGDVVGLFPVAYLDRALKNFGAIDWSKPPQDAWLASTIADKYVMEWPLRYSDGTFSRNVGWPGQQDGNASFLWSDDVFMGVLLLTHLASAGHPRGSEYIETAANMQVTASGYLLDVGQYPGFSINSSLFFHGYNANNGTLGRPSCCYWGRANGWALMGNVEVLKALPSSHPLRPKVLQVFQRHATGMLQVQSSDGRWHQVLNETSTYLETSVTAMTTWAFSEAIQYNLLDRQTFLNPTQKAWNALAQTVQDDGTVTGICCGTGVQTSVAAYEARSTNYNISQPGLGSVWRAAISISTLK